MAGRGEATAARVAQRAVHIEHEHEFRVSNAARRLAQAESKHHLNPATVDRLRRELEQAKASRSFFYLQAEQAGGAE